MKTGIQTRAPTNTANMDSAELPDPRASLTPRECVVLALMAQGLTHREIAQRLFVSLNTVSTHVQHVLRKLNIASGTSDNQRALALLTYLARTPPR